MKYARIGTNGQEVEASRAKRRSDYLCPSCGARVRLRLGDEREPHFAHVANEGSLDCDNYFPGHFSGESLPAHHERSVQELAGDTRLCVDDTADAWHLYLRLPEIHETDPATLTISALRDALVVIRCGAEVVQRMPGWDIRPRVGVARAVVPPSTSDYVASPEGTWPPGVDANACSCTVRALEPDGTLFRPLAGEWSRIPEGAVVRRGEPLIVVALRDQPPPNGCAARPSEVVATFGGTWRLWRVTVPSRPCPAVDEWLESLGHTVEPPTWQVEVKSLPHSLTADGATRQFLSGSPVVIAITPPPSHSALASLTLVSGSTSQTTSVAAKNGATVYAVARVSALGPATVRVAEEHEAAVTFEVVMPDSAEVLRRALDSMPRLRVNIGDVALDPWPDQKPGVMTLQQPTIATVEVGGLQARVNIGISGRTTRWIGTRLKPSEAGDVISRELNAGGALHVEVDSGALGRVAFDVRRRTPGDRPGPAWRAREWFKSVALALDPSTAVVAFGNNRAVGPRITYALQSSATSVVGAHVRALRNRKAHTP